MDSLYKAKTHPSECVFKDLIVDYLSGDEIKIRAIICIPINNPRVIRIDGNRQK